MSTRRRGLAVSLLIVAAVWMAACQRTPPAIPTVAQLPTITPTVVAMATTTRRPLPATWTPTDTFTPTYTRTPTPTFTLTFTPTPTFTPTATFTATPTFTPTFTPSNTPTDTPIPSPTPRLPPTATLTQPPPPTPLPIIYVSVPAMPAGLSGTEARLWQTPVLPSFSVNVRTIYNRGLSLGNRATVFTTVGDCHTQDAAFMAPLGSDRYTLGPHSYLQGTINFFTAPPRDGVPNSWVNGSIAASSAFNAAAVFDPTWSPPDLCTPGEAPLDCEYRLTRPAAAVIMLGSVDMQIYDLGTFRFHLEQVVTSTINRGIIPLLTTFPSDPSYLWGESLAFNGVILDLAQQYQIPLINLWLATRGLPANGLQADGYHLTRRADGWADFNGDERQYGVTLRNLITLQALYLLQQTVL